ncbi:hypothetical protein KJ742_06690 [Patescibacteria group bacterium]|nr:hypothetical protein [Patescibacteria group bacterium]MBU1683599.1 hypothetical protein [Patescibacteria group bacterium]MBU1934436.1 hypothetical protein [Patescibacteria group bacterium]
MKKQTKNNSNILFNKRFLFFAEGAEVQNQEPIESDDAIADTLDASEEGDEQEAEKTYKQAIIQTPLGSLEEIPPAFEDLINNFEFHAIFDIYESEIGWDIQHYGQGGEVELMSGDEIKNELCAFELNFDYDTPLPLSTYIWYAIDNAQRQFILNNDLEGLIAFQNYVNNYTEEMQKNIGIFQNANSQTGSQYERATRRKAREIMNNHANLLKTIKTLQVYHPNYEYIT